jgi:hypothetical protein
VTIENYLKNYIFVELDQNLLSREKLNQEERWGNNEMDENLVDECKIKKLRIGESQVIADKDKKLKKK